MVLAISTVFLSTPAFTQIKQWVDENGTVHYEATESNGAKNTEPRQGKPNAIQPIIARSQGGFSLGDDESSFKAFQSGIFLGKSGAEANYYQYYGDLPEGGIDMGLMFIDGRLAFIVIQYRDFGLGGWDQLIKQTTNNYGPPTEDSQTAVWSDDTTALTLTREPTGNIVMTLENLTPMAKYSDQARTALPKF